MVRLAGPRDKYVIVHFYFWSCDEERGCHVPPHSTVSYSVGYLPCLKNCISGVVLVCQDTVKLLHKIE